MSAGILLNVNGKRHHVDAGPDTPLLYVLRNDLALKGPKFGCGLEQCGACKVLVDGEAVPSCRLPIGEVEGVPITTVEGLGTADAPHPLQQAFIEEQAIQCGYCAAGMIIGAQGLLNRNPAPTDDEIRRAMADHLCRCGVYDRVRRAIRHSSGQPSDSTVYERRTAEPAAPAADHAQELPRSLLRTPALDAWVRINTDGTVTLFTGKVELGQGLKTAVAQIGAEELDVSPARVRVVMADTEQSPDEGMTVGSMSLETTGNAVRLAAAEARQQLLAIAYEALEVPLERLTVSDGVIRDPVTERQVSYWELFGGQRFGTQVTGTVSPRGAQAHTIVGRPVERVDLPAKVRGEAAFVHDLDLPAMVHGRVVRPPHTGARLRSVDGDAVARMRGVLKVVRDGSFLAIIAEREEVAVQAAAALRERAGWEGESPLTSPEELYESLFEQPDAPALIVDGTSVEEPVPPVSPPPGTARTLEATFRRPYQMHASLGPSAAVALMREGKLTIWAQTQGVFPQRAAIARVLGMAEGDVHVIHRDGAGCYGHNGADDAALDAALLARAVPGRPVSLKWMREDEHGWEPYAPPMVVELQASLDDSGTVIDWNHDVWSPAHMNRPLPREEESGLVAAWHLDEPLPAPPAKRASGTHSGSFRNADPLYAFARRRVVDHFLPHSPLRTSSMRGLGAYANIFAIESFMDELAGAAGEDPVAFRLRHLSDARARAVLEAAAEKAGWAAGRRDTGRGRGIALAQYKNRQTYAAIVVTLRVDESSGRIHLDHVVIAADAGQIINPDGLSNQLEGGFVQSASMTLLEQVRWDEGGITSLDWESYPIMRFPDAPVIESVLLDRPGRPHVGAGEATQGPTPAAIANAIFDATGIRLREIPFTPERVKRALQQK